MTKKRFTAELIRHGATVDESIVYSLIVDAPDFHVWDSSGDHAICEPLWRGRTLADARASAIERMAGGVRPCDRDECDMCDEARERQGANDGQ